MDGLELHNDGVAERLTLELEGQPCLSPRLGAQEQRDASPADAFDASAWISKLRRRRRTPLGSHADSLLCDMPAGDGQSELRRSHGSRRVAER